MQIKNTRAIFAFFFIIIFPTTSFTQPLDFIFFNSSGKEYRTTTLSNQLEKEYNYKFDEKMILMEIPNLKDSLYLLQNEILELLNAESLQLIYITACLTKEYEHGYHTSIEVAKELMGENPRCRIRILDSNANILFESNEIISAKEIENILLN